jgi:hypothetical protein
MSFAAYIRKIEGGLAFAMRVLTPGFLRRLDRWLLLNQPWLWRTRLVPMVLLAVLLGLGYYAFGHLTPISSKTMPTITDVSTVWSIMLLIGLIILGFWLVPQIRWPLPSMSLQQLFYTGAIYALIVFCLTASPAAYSIPLSIRMASAVPDDVFDDDTRSMRPMTFWSVRLR